MAVYPFFLVSVVYSSLTVEESADALSLANTHNKRKVEQISYP